MRIVLVGTGVHPIPPTGYGAIERVLGELKPALEAAGQQVRIVNRVRGRRMRDEIPFAWELPRLLRDEPYDVLHAHTPVVGNRLAGRGLPFVYTSHSRHWYYRQSLTDRWGYYLERRAVRRAAAVVALTEPLADTMRRTVRPPLPPLRVIPLGVDTSRFAPRWELRSGRRALGVGVVAPFKRWHLAAAALRGTGVELSIAGPIVSRDYADEVRRHGDHVTLLGEVPEEELERRFAESDYLVHPSSVEVLSVVVLQGLAAGLPVVGGASVRGVVEEAVTGWSVPDDPSGLVTGLRERIQRLSADDGLRRTIGEAARRSAQDRFSWAGIAAHHVDLYRSVAGGRPVSLGGSAETVAR